MAKYFIVYGNETNLDFNCYIPHRPTKPSAEKEFEDVPIPGGETLYREKYCKDIEIAISFNFVSKSPSDWESEYRNIKRWLNSKKEILKFSDDLEVFYKVKKVRIDTPERTLKKLGKFTVIFTCSPYTYYEDGSYEIELSKYIYNNYTASRPIYRVVGEGLLNLGINGKEVQINVGQEVIINTDLGLCFRNGMTSNTTLKGEYKDLYLKEGYNTFTWSGDFKVYIVPNWRCLS